MSTNVVTVLLETMTGAGNLLGASFAQLGSIIRLVENKKRVRVCLDTCHIFAAGYDIRTKEGWESTMAEFEREVGLPYLRGMHLNDAGDTLGSRKDLHTNIGLGHIGLPTFMHILADTRTQNIPLILETPTFDKLGETEIWPTELSVLSRAVASAGASDMDGWMNEIRGAVYAAINRVVAGAAQETNRKDRSTDEGETSNQKVQRRKKLK